MLCAQLFDLLRKGFAVPKPFLLAGGDPDWASGRHYSINSIVVSQLRFQSRVKTAPPDKSERGVNGSSCTCGMYRERERDAVLYSMYDGMKDYNMYIGYF